MLRYILVRHAESEANIDETVRQYTKECDIPITQKGYLDCAAAAKEIQPRIKNEKPITVILSPYLRAKQTFEEINKTLAINIQKIYEDVRLRELDYGNAVMRTKEEQIHYINQKGSVFYYQHPDGESYTNLLTRLATLNNEILGEWRENDYQDKTVLMIAHAHVLAAWDILLLKKDIKKVNYKMKNCEIREYVKTRQQSFYKI